MKKFYSFVFLLVCLGSSAQNWCPPGATWHYRDYSSLGGIEGITEYKYIKDTVINTINCKLIASTRTSSFLGGVPFVNPNQGKFYSYENNRVVYLYNGTTFDTVVNYNATVGSKWLRLKDDWNTARNAVTVTNVGQITVNGATLTTLKIAYHYATAPGSTVSTTFTTEIAEKLSCISGGYAAPMLFPFYGSLGRVSDYSTNTFVCYTDNNFPVYNTRSVNCNYLSVGINKLSVENLGYQIYPNPALQSLNINSNRLQQDHEARLIDIQGREMANVSLRENTKIDLQALDSGIYFLQVFEKGKLIGTEKIIKE